jgi:hypothetical protein
MLATAVDAGSPETSLLGAEFFAEAESDSLAAMEMGDETGAGAVVVVAQVAWPQRQHWQATACSTKWGATRARACRQTISKLIPMATMARTIKPCQLLRRSTQPI